MGSKQAGADAGQLLPVQSLAAHSRQPGAVLVSCLGKRVVHLWGL